LAETATERVKDPETPGDIDVLLITEDSTA
jgi:hypothetical protein